MITTIGLEVHVQLGSKTKIFCGCEVKFAAPPNSQVCPVCLGLPGVLPVLNKEVFKLGLRAVLAMNGTPSKIIKFDRKNYFYPDLPKGYQISQFDKPLGQGGFIELSSGKKVRLNRAHLEEDAGKLIHDQSPDTSMVDLNRAGTPLLEIVSEPDIDNPEEAYDYLTNLKAILKAVGVSECDMEKGHLRCDANVSVRKNAADPLGKRVEIKNLNSFKAVKAAIEYEVGRQSVQVEKNEVVVQETRLWEDEKGKTHPMRSKEDAHDYRYFPEPDLVPFSVNEDEIKKAKAEIPELPKEKRTRFIKDYGLTEYDARLITEDPGISLFFEKTVEVGKNPKTIANWIIGPVFAYLSANVETGRPTGSPLRGLTPTLLTRLIELVEKGEISHQAAKEKIFPDVMEHGRDPESVINEKGLKQVSDDSALDSWILEAISTNPKVVGDFKSGKETAAMFLVGQVMKKSQGKANPGKVRERMLEKLRNA